MNKLHFGDCMDMMREKPDGFWDLVIADPPYGIEATVEIGLGDTKSGRINRPSKWAQKEWDKNRPTKDFFNELKRVSKNQIIFGGNYFADLLPPSRCWIVWDKMQRVNQADAELAWTSFTNSVRVYQFHCNKLQGFMNPDRFHPTEKPVALYKWLLQNYAKPGDKILDPMMGSGSSRIAAWDMGFEYWGCELDGDYFAGQEKRFAAHTSKPLLFQPGEMYNFEQTKLFAE